MRGFSKLKHIMSKGLVTGILALAGLSLALAGCASAQETEAQKIPRIGFLSASATPSFIEALQEGFTELGYVEGENIIIDWRVVEDQSELPAIAAEFVAQEVDVIIAGGTKAVKAAKAQTTTIPIVMTNSGDAVRTGLVDSLARPGGNVTGSTQISPQLTGKRIELLKEAIPDLSTLAVMWNKDHANTQLMFAEIEKVVPQLGLELQSLEISKDDPDFQGAFEAASAEGAEVVLVLRDPLMVRHQQQITSLAAESRLPAMYETTNFMDAGGLMIYGPSFKALYKRAATFTHKILNGANPSEMPVEHPIAFDLVVNLDVAEAIGITFPESFLLRTTELVRN